MNWTFTAEQVISGEYPISMDEYLKMLYAGYDFEELLNYQSSKVNMDALRNDLQYMVELRQSFFLHYFNIIFSLSLGQPVAITRRVASKTIQNFNMRKFFTRKDNIDRIIEMNKASIDILSAIIKNFTANQIELGTSFKNLNNSLYMQVLNSLSMVISDVRKNENLRKQIVTFNLGDEPTISKIKRMIGL